MHKQKHQEHLHGIRKDRHWFKGKTVNFEAFDLADVMIISNYWLNKLYFMQYYTESNINAENPDLAINKQPINTLMRKHCFIENVDHVPDFESGFWLSTPGIFSQNIRARKSYSGPT
jgi:hypothetical protein